MVTCTITKRAEYCDSLSFAKLTFTTKSCVSVGRVCVVVLDYGVVDTVWCRDETSCLTCHWLQSQSEELTLFQMSLVILELHNERKGVFFRLNPPEGKEYLYSYAKMAGGLKLQSLAQLEEKD